MQRYSKVILTGRLGNHYVSKKLLSYVVEVSLDPGLGLRWGW